MPAIIQGLKRKLMSSDHKIVKMYCENEVIYSSGNLVTYQVDDNVIRSYEVDTDVDVVKQVPFTPTKQGYKFVGWRDDTQPDSSVLNSKVMDTDPIILYAVFEQSIVVTCYNDNTTPNKSTKSKYYNNGNYKNPVFNFAQIIKEGWSKRGWSTAPVGNASIVYDDGEDFTAEANITLYGMYEQTITVSYYDNSSNVKKKTGTRYYNSNGNVVNPTFILKQSAKSGWIARGWSTGTSGDAHVSCNDGVVFGAESNVTLYGLYYRTCTLTCISYNKTENIQSNAYYNSSGNIMNAIAAAPAGASYNGWTWRGWSNGDVSATASEAFNKGSAVELGTDNCTIYGLYQQIVTCHFGSYNSVQSVSGIRYYNAVGDVENATIVAPSGSAWNGWTWRGWSPAGNTSAEANVAYDNKDTINGISSELTFFGLYQQTITLSYNGNGANSGSVNSQTGIRYCNIAGNYSNPSFKLAANGFTLIDHNFSGWDLGAAGASITLDSNKTAKAQWTRIPAQPFYIFEQSPTYTRAVNQNHGGIGGYDPSVDNPYWSIVTYQGGGSEWVLGTSKSSPISRRHCTKCKFSVFILEGSSNFIQIGNTRYEITNNGGTLVDGIRVHEVDISREADTIQVTLGNQTGGSDSNLQILAPYFY